METNLNEQQLLRRQSLEELHALGIDPYPAELYPVNTNSEEIKSAELFLLIHLLKIFYLNY
jgi:hypothetical protein